MKKYILICALFIITDCKAQNSILDLHKSYFYIDTECLSCTLNENELSQNNYLITDSFYLDILNERVIENYINDFKIKIIQTYKNPEPLLNNIVLRRLDEENEIVKLREINIKKHSTKGYKVSQIPFSIKKLVVENRIDNYLRNTETFGFSGTVLVSEKGEIIHQNSYGWAIPKYELKNTNEILFNIGSISKSFTAQAILDLVTQKKLSLNSTLEEIFIDVSEDKRKVTIHQLLTHTSGYKRNVLQLDEKVNSYVEARRRILDQPLTFEPGEKYNYSNAGYQLLGLIVEEISKYPVDLFLKKNVFEPNGIVGIGFFHNVPKNTIVASSLNEWNSENFIPFEKRQYSNLSSTGIVANTVGLYSWFNFLQSNKEVYELMSIVQIEEKTEYGYGFFLDDGGNIIFSSGDHGDYHSLLSYDTKNDRLIIILSNTSLYNFGVHKNIISKKIAQILDTNTKPYFEASPIKSAKNIEGLYKNSDFEISIQPFNHELKLLLLNQTTINYFYEPDSTKLVSINNKKNELDSISRLIKNEQFIQLENWLGTFYSKIIKEDYQFYSKEYGHLTDIKIVGTIPLPWNSPNYQSIIILTFGGKKIDFRIVWNGENIYETLTETKHPQGAILFLGKNNEGNWITYNFVKEKLDILSFDMENRTAILVLPKKNNNHHQRLKRQ